MFKPHVTVACVVHAEDKFLIVEETINGKALWNQPAGHLEANETLLQAAERELWEETGIRATPHLQGLGENPAIRAMFVSHLHQALAQQLEVAA